MCFNTRGFGAAVIDGLPAPGSISQGGVSLLPRRFTVLSAPPLSPSVGIINHRTKELFTSAHPYFKMNQYIALGKIGPVSDLIKLTIKSLDSSSGSFNYNIWSLRHNGLFCCIKIMYATEHATGL